MAGAAQRDPERNGDDASPSERQAAGREKGKAETRRALVVAAAAAFAELGLDAPSLDSICARAGYTRGAFYVHFRDRDELIAAVMERYSRGFLDTVIAAGEAFDIDRTISAFVEAVVAGRFPLGKGASIPMYQVLQACSRSEVVRDRFVAVLAEGVRRVADAARRGQQAKSMRSDVRPEHVATLLVGLVLAAQSLIELDVPVDVRGLAATVLHLLRDPDTGG